MANAVRAIDFAIDHHVDVISASWGGNLSRDDATPLLEAMERARQAGNTL